MKPKLFLASTQLLNLLAVILTAFVTATLPAAAETQTLKRAFEAGTVYLPESYVCPSNGSNSFYLVSRNIYHEIQRISVEFEHGEISKAAVAVADNESAPLEVKIRLVAGEQDERRKNNS